MRSNKPKRDQPTIHSNGNGERHTNSIGNNRHANTNRDHKSYPVEESHSRRDNKMVKEEGNSGSLSYEHKKSKEELPVTTHGRSRDIFIRSNENNSSTREYMRRKESREGRLHSFVNEGNQRLAIQARTVPWSKRTFYTVVGMDSPIEASSPLSENAHSECAHNSNVNPPAFEKSSYYSIQSTISCIFYSYENSSKKKHTRK